MTDDSISNYELDSELYKRKILFTVLKWAMSMSLFSMVLTLTLLLTRDYVSTIIIETVLVINTLILWYAYKILQQGKTMKSARIYLSMQLLLMGFLTSVTTLAVLPTPVIGLGLCVIMSISLDDTNIWKWGIITIIIWTICYYMRSVIPVMPDSAGAPVISYILPTCILLLHIKFGNVTVESLKIALIKSEKAQIKLEDQIEALNNLREHLETIVDERTSALRDALSHAHIAKNEAVTASNHKSQFLANMSHEFRSPLTSVIGLSEILIDDGDTMNDHIKRDFIETIYQEGNHLLKLINDILDLSKVESGVVELYLESINLDDILSSIQYIFQMQAVDKNIQISVNNEVILPIWADEARVKQIMQNLLSNAMKFTNRGSIEIHAKQDKDSAIISVKDTGIGISQENIDIIFESFQQVQSDFQREYQGSGLGLSITKQFVEILQGNIWVESTVGVGSTFFFTLPLAQFSIKE